MLITQTDRYTDHATSDICSNRLHIIHYAQAMRSNNWSLPYNKVILRSAKEDNIFVTVCLFVCRLVRQSKSQEQIFVTFLEAELKGLASRNNRIRSLSVWMLEHGYLKIASKWLQSSGNTLASTNKTRKPKSRSHRPLSQHFLFVTLNTDLWLLRKYLT